MMEAVAITVIVSSLFTSSPVQGFICDGVWKVQSIENCENRETYKFDCDVKRRKINRTHDGFSLRCDFPEDVTDSFALNVETYTKVDGGDYKFDQNLADDSMCRFMNMYGKANFERALSMAGYDPPNCPIPKGLFELKEYVVDYSELPPKAKCGEHKNFIYVLQGDEKVGCGIAYTSFTAKEYDDDD